MNYLQSTLSIALGLIVLTGCESRDIYTDTTGGSTSSTSIPSGETSVVRFLEINDLHAHLLPHLEQVRNDDGSVSVKKMGGLARISTFLTERKDENTIVMNIGDTYHGGGVAMFSNGNDIVKLVNELPIDIGVIGNWDYAYGPTVTNARFGTLEHSGVLRPNFLHLAANVEYQDPVNITNLLAQYAMQELFEYEVGEEFLPATAHIQKGDIDVGIIGLTSDIVEKMHVTMAFNLKFTQGEEAYKALVEKHAKALREQGADLVVVMSELGIHKDLHLANGIEKESVDIFFSAHTHEATFEMLESDSGAVVVESGNDAYIGELMVAMNSGEVIEMEWALHKIDESIEPDADLQAKIDATRAPYLKENPNITAEYLMPESIPSFLSGLMPVGKSITMTHSLEEPLAETTIALDRRDALESNFNNAFTDILREHTQTDVAMSAGFRFDSSVIPEVEVFEGDDYIWQKEDSFLLDNHIYTENVYRFFPAPFTLSTAQVSVKRLKEVIEENLDSVFSENAFMQAGGWFDGYSGLRMDVDLRAEAKLIALLHVEGKTLNDDTVLNVAGCSRPMDQEGDTTLCSYSGFIEVTPIINPSTDSAYFASDFMIDKLLEGALTTLKSRHDIHDVSQRPLWPESLYYQPLD